MSFWVVSRIDFAELVYGFHGCHGVSVLFLKFFVCFGPKNKKNFFDFCQLNDYGKLDLNESRMIQRLLDEAVSSD